MIIGDRQIVQHAKHPTLGEGRLVYDSGPTFFLADSGEAVALQHAGPGGSKSGPPRYSYSTAQQDGKRIELDTTDRKCGPRHMRIVTLDGRPGWLSWWFDDSRTTGKRTRPSPRPRRRSLTP